MSESGTDCCACRADEERAATDAAYRRALWIVVVLNLGFGVLELLGGFVARSEALKADSLDFIGDGSITFIGLLALSWSERKRNGVALAQGIFLAGLGCGVLATAIWRALNAVLPSAEIMSVLGIAGLAVNVTAALALLKFRKTGDANARAIWLFSRNDALANIAVIGAAGLVYWTRSPWPDILVAAVIAALFLHSAYEIVREHLPNAMSHPKDR